MRYIIVLVCACMLVAVLEGYRQESNRQTLAEASKKLDFRGTVQIIGTQKCETRAIFAVIYHFADGKTHVLSDRPTSYSNYFYLIRVLNKEIAKGLPIPAKFNIHVGSSEEDSSWAEWSCVGGPADTPTSQVLAYRFSIDDTFAKMQSSYLLNLKKVENR